MLRFTVARLRLHSSASICRALVANIEYVKHLFAASSGICDRITCSVV